ncbi:MAG: hypothetical protein R3362_03925, partial [Rhodothermales bacterium]|nr:hypothetical protein [Rhodothermales bacterium]
MKPFATAQRAVLLLALAALFSADLVQAQTPVPVTIRQLNEIPADNIAQLEALGPDADINDIQDLLTNEFLENSTPVIVEAVLLTDPYSSGAATVNDGVPNRVQVFVRDTAAETEGVEGMTIQVVDDTQSGLILDFLPGDVIEIEATLEVFTGTGGASWQLTPIDSESITLVGSEDLSQDWLQPVTVTTSDVNEVVAEVGGQDLVQINWSNWNSLNNQYVRIENAVTTNSDLGGASDPNLARPDWAFSSVGEDSRVSTYDISLRYRTLCSGNSPCHEEYPNPPFNSRPDGDPFIPPPVGAAINVQGFLLFQGDGDPFNMGSPEEAYWNIVPFEDSDLEILSSPPIIALSVIDYVPTDDITVEAEIVPGGVEPITSATLSYSFSTGESGDVEMTNVGGDTFEGVIPVEEAQDGAFVTYFVTAEDGAGLESMSSEATTRVLLDGIDDIEDIQIRS